MSTGFTFETIGTTFWVEIFDEVNDKTLEAAKSRLERFSSLFNERYSRFLPESAISVLNRERRLEHPSEECRALLSYGKDLFVRSQGVFNLLTGHILEARGYDATYSFTPKEGHDRLPLCNPITDLTITNDVITLTCGHVDLGGYGKGYLVDCLAKELRTLGINYFLVNGGGDMYGSSNHDEPITIYMEHPLDATKYLIPTTLKDQGFAASSPFKRQWKSGDQTYTHIITEGEVPPLASFAKARNTTDADALATVCLLLPEAELPAIAAREGCAFARFNPETGELWQTTHFSTL